MAYAFLYLYFKFDGGFFTVAKLQFEYNQHQPVGENQVTGNWLDLSGQDYCPNLHTDESIDDCDETNFIRCLKMNESENILFDEIKNSFPYYQRKKKQQIKDRQGQHRALELTKSISIVLFMSIVLFLVEKYLWTI